MKQVHTYLKVVLLVVLTVFVLTGCLFPKEEQAKNQVPYEDQLELVQTSIEKYQEKTGGLLPISTKSSDTPIFEKYIIEFDQLEEENLISDIPGNSFESGGVYRYVLIDVEENPTVKLIDLRTTNAVQSLYTKVNTYRNKHIHPPFGKKIEKDLYTIDYEKLGLESEPTAVSPFTQNNVPIIMNVDGDLFIDYRSDLTTYLAEEEHSFKNGDDIRYILPENSPFVPAYSMPYTIEDDEAVFLIK